MLRTVDTSMEQRLCTFSARPSSSPELYSLKKSAGRDSIRITTAACTERFSFVFTRAENILFTVCSSMVLTDTLTINTVRPSSMESSPPGTTTPKSRLLIFGPSIPTRETMAVPRTVRARSVRSKHSSM